MYLKALEIQGFKSFPDKTTLKFEKEITAIVGPNGSGKSNISDALLWVMGEQRSKALRGGKMEDVIFGGTEKRSPMGFAQVSLVLDNSAGLFEIDSPEVTITRRYYRTGDSEYYVNRESVRLRDIVTLLMDTGMGRDGYSVIGQGRIAEIVSARSMDRREIFEEATGIARYRFRKEEAERKLERTEDNLLRINDKIDELSMQVEPLKKQAETAKKYLLLRDEQRSLEISLWMETLDRLHRESEKLSGEFASVRDQLEAAQAALEQLYAESEGISQQMRDCDVAAEQVRSRASEADNTAAELESAAAVLEAGQAHDRDSIRRLREEIDAQSGRTETLSRQVEEYGLRVREIQEALAGKAEEAGRISAEAEQSLRETDLAARELAELADREGGLNDAITKAATARELLEGQKAELQERTGAIDGDIRSASERLDRAKTELDQAEQAHAAAQAAAAELGERVSGLRTELGSCEGAVKERTERSNRLIVEKRSTEGRVKMLSDMEKEYEGFGKAAKTVMRAAERGALTGVHGPVASLIRVPDRYTVAVETALGAALQNIVVDSQNSGKAAIEYLKRSDGGRATFLPVDTIRGAALSSVPSREPGFVGVASELISFDSRYAGIVGNLLGRTVVAETLGDAVQMSRRYDNRLRIVTLDGQMINAGGSMTGGSAARNVGILSRANELRQLRQRLKDLTEQEREAALALAEAERALTETRFESEKAGAEWNDARDALRKRESDLSSCRMVFENLEETVSELEQEKAGLAGRLRETEERMAGLDGERAELEAALAELKAEAADRTEGRKELEQRGRELADRLAALRAEAAGLESEREAALRAAEQLRELIDSLSGDSADRERAIRELEDHCAGLAGEISEKKQQAAARRTEAEAHRAHAAELNGKRLELEGRRTRREKQSQEKNREIQELQGVCAKFEQKLQSAAMEEEQTVAKLWDSYELSRTAAQQLRQPLESFTAASRRVSELRREINRLGPVNVGAIEEYDRVSERWNFLTGQRDDVEAARKDLVKIIREISVEMKDIFVTQFQAIAECFRTVFLELFGGGKASLELEDPEDPLGCGIEIRVQPPGKAVTSISLLSGGEKSFVAICLYFAIIKVRPTPFCIMDEIDAALDEANVERYARYMRSLTAHTQFITITHHRATMEEADMLYGVTMQERGVTTVLSVDLEEAEAIKD